MILFLRDEFQAMVTISSITRPLVAEDLKSLHEDMLENKKPIYEIVINISSHTLNRTSSSMLMNLVMTNIEGGEQVVRRA